MARRHWIFTGAAVVAVLPRAVAMLGFQPALFFRLDSYDYLRGAVRVSPNVVNVSGYSLFLWLLRPLHSIVVVAGAQHLMGIGVASLMYALLRRYRLPAWGASLAAAPVLFDPAQLLAEQLVMADVLAMTLMMAGLTVLSAGRAPSLPAGVAAGLLTGAGGWAGEGAVSVGRPGRRWWRPGARDGDVTGMAGAGYRGCGSFCSRRYQR